jgi:hypothetical protein
MDGTGNLYVTDSLNNAIRMGWPTSGGVGVTITVPPQSQVANAGATVSFSVTATGTGQLSYQWRFNGASIPGATSSTLTLNFVGAGNSGPYSVVVSNAYGSATSAAATLAVITDGANGKTPTQVPMPAAPPKTTGIDSLVVVTHGYELEGPLADVSWVNELANAIQANAPANWLAYPYIWKGWAWGVPPNALAMAALLGTGFGSTIAQQHWRQVHLIAHSAGAAFIESVAEEIKAISPSTTVQCTFLDPYVGLVGEFRGDYGQAADWSDEYYTAIDETSFDPVGAGVPLPKAYAVDVSWLDPGRQQAQYFGPGGGVIALSSHGWSYQFYTQSITDTDPSWGGAGYGYCLSMEKDGTAWSNNQLYDPVGSGPFLPGSPGNAVQNLNSGLGALQSVELGVIIDIGDLMYAVGGGVANLVGCRTNSLPPLVYWAFVLEHV